MDRRFYAVGRSALGKVGCSVRVNGLKFLRSALKENAGEIDRRIGLSHQHRKIVTFDQIGLDDLDLPDPPHRTQKVRSVWVAHTDANAPPLSRQCPHNVTPEKTRTTDDGDEFRRGNCSHAESAWGAGAFLSESNAQAKGKQS